MVEVERQKMALLENQLDLDCRREDRLNREFEHRREHDMRLLQLEQRKIRLEEAKFHKRC